MADVANLLSDSCLYMPTNLTHILMLVTFLVQSGKVMRFALFSQNWQRLPEILGRDLPRSLPGTVLTRDTEELNLVCLACKMCPSNKVN